MPDFVVGRRAEVDLFDDLLDGRVPYRWLDIYGPGGIGKTVVGGKLLARAFERRIPAAAVDGSDGGLTPDRILRLFMEGLTSAPAGEHLADAFRAFDREFRDYLLVNDVLRQGGGLGALFDAVGAVKDPVGLAGLLGGLGSAATEAVQRTVSNRMALERYLRGAERALTRSFVDGLAAAASVAGKPVALLIDTYEELEHLDDWVRSSLAPGLPPEARLVILGRDELHRLNFEWNEHGDKISSQRLPDLSEEDARAYLRHYGLTDPIALDQVYRFTGGYPLLLVLARQLAREAGGWTELEGLDNNADRDTIATQLLERILRQSKVAEARAFLEKGVVARWFDPEMVAVILEINLDDARQIYDKLRRHSFIERHPLGLKFHDKIRELLLARLRHTSESEYNRLRQRLMAHLEGQGDAQLDLKGPAPTGPTSRVEVRIQSAHTVVIGDDAQVSTSRPPDAPDPHP